MAERDLHTTIRRRRGVSLFDQTDIIQKPIVNVIRESVARLEIPADSDWCAEFFDVNDGQVVISQEGARNLCSFPVESFEGVSVTGVLSQTDQTCCSTVSDMQSLQTAWEEHECKRLRWPCC